jgi:hypothetical protein
MGLPGEKQRVHRGGLEKANRSSLCFGRFCRFSRFSSFRGVRAAVQLGKHGRHTILPGFSPLLTQVGKFVASKTVDQADGQGDGQERQNMSETTMRTFSAITIHSVFHFFISYFIRLVCLF